MDLEKDLSELKDQLRKQLPQEMHKVNDRLVEELVQKGQAAKGPQEGDCLQDFLKDFNFILSDAFGRQIEFSDLIKSGPVVLSFYRGGWCPYCNLELKVLKAEAAAIRKLGARLVAISPEKPDSSLTLQEKEALDFIVLSDESSELAKSLGISYVVPEYLLSTFASYGLDLSKHYNRKKVELPIPATYVIDQNLTVRYGFASEDFTKRAKITRILGALQQIKAEK